MPSPPLSTESTSSEGDKGSPTAEGPASPSPPPLPLIAKLSVARFSSAAQNEDEAPESPRRSSTPQLRSPRSSQVSASPMNVSDGNARCVPAPSAPYICCSCCSSPMNQGIYNLSAARCARSPFSPGGLRLPLMGAAFSAIETALGSPRFLRRRCSARTAAHLAAGHACAPQLPVAVRGIVAFDKETTVRRDAALGPRVLRQTGL